MFSLTTVFFLVEIVVGYITNSMALVADSFHMLSDIAALVIAFLSVRMAPKSWSKNTFGWARAEVLGALVNAVFLVALCFSITVEALKRFYEPEEIHNPQIILIVGGVGLAVNLVGLVLFHEHGSSHGHSHGLSRSTHSHLTDLADREEKEEINEIVYSGKESSAAPKAQQHSHNHHGHSHGAGNMNMRGVFLHVMADALGSVVVIISAIIMWKTDWEYKLYVDPGLSLCMVLLILRSVWPLLIDSALILLQTVPTHIQVDALQRKLMEKVEGILAVHEFHVWQLAGDRIIASAHIRCLNLTEYMEVAEKVKEFFHNEGIHSTTIQPEFVETVAMGQISSSEDCMLACPKGPGGAAAAGGCEASKCCPPVSKTPSTANITSARPRSQQASPNSRHRKTSSVSISQDLDAGFCGLVLSPGRSSAPNLSLNQGSPDQTAAVELTAELNLSDEAPPSSHNSSFSKDREGLGEVVVGTRFASSTPLKPLPPPSSSSINLSSSSGRLHTSRSATRFSPGEPDRQQQQQLPMRQDSSEQQQQQLQAQEELTPMVPRTTTRVVRVISKQSNV